MQQYQIREWIDVLMARRAVRILAVQIGFPSREASELYSPWAMGQCLEDRSAFL